MTERVEIRADPWLSEVMKRPVHRLDLASGGEGLEPVLCAHAAAHPAGFYFTRVDTRNVPLVHRLERLGFGVVDTTLVFERDTETPTASGDVPVREAADDERESVLDLAAHAFELSRFHLDPAVGSALADRIKRRWIESYFERQRGDRLFVAGPPGQPLGFLAALKTDDVAVIDLIGVRADARGAGAGGALARAFFRHYAPECRAFRVGTQAANIGSARFYERLGFRLAQTQYVMHHHTAGGPP